LQAFYRSREQLDRDAATEQPAAVGEREVLFPVLADPPRQQPQTFQPAEHHPLAQANIALELPDLTRGHASGLQRLQVRGEPRCVPPATTGDRGDRPDSEADVVPAAPGG